MSSVEHLWETVLEAWNFIPKETLCRYIDTMPARVNAVLKSKGWHTRY